MDAKGIVDRSKINNVVDINIRDVAVIILFGKVQKHIHVKVKFSVVQGKCISIE